MSLFPIDRGAKCLNLSLRMELHPVCMDGSGVLGGISGWRWVWWCWEGRRAWKRSFQQGVAKGS